MIEWIAMYVSLALAGSLMTWFHIYLPVRKMFIADKENEHPYVKSPIFSSLVWIALAALLIPFLVSAILFEDKRKVFIEYTYKGAK